MKRDFLVERITAMMDDATTEFLDLVYRFMRGGLYQAGSRFRRTK